MALKEQIYDTAFRGSKNNALVIVSKYLIWLLHRNIVVQLVVTLMEKLMIGRKEGAHEEGLLSYTLVLIINC